MAASLKIDKTLNPNLTSSLTMGVGQYSYVLKETDPSNAFDLTYDVTYPSLNFDFEYSRRHKFNVGVNTILYLFNPGTIEPKTSVSSIDPMTIQRKRSLESALYFSDEFSLNERLSFEIGLRYSLCANLGSATVYQYAPNLPREIENIIDSTTFKKNQIIKLYHGPEPRISVTYGIGTNASFKFGYQRMYQYLHFISNTTAASPVDTWQSVDSYLKPQTGNQLSIGYFKNQKSIYELSVEAYYKRINNIHDFKDGSDLILNKNIETALLPGITNSYGIEFSVSKVKGRLTGSGNYTFSRSLLKVTSDDLAGSINDGKPYPSNYDQPHAVNINWQYGISRRIFFSGNFSYRTGRPISLPERIYVVDGVPVSDFPRRNNYRIPDYHRMDIALIVEGSHKLKKAWSGSWVFSFYNVYARKNAYTVFFNNDGTGRLQPYQLSVIGTVIPSVTYRFKF
jgi:hypothetical protein